MRLIIARHAQPDLAATNVDPIAGPPLSEAGRQQARALAMRLAHDRAGLEPIVFTSPMLRAHQTASIICEQLGLGPPEVIEALAGLTPAELNTPGPVTPERFAAVRTLAWPAVQTLIEPFETNARVLLVAHEVTIRALVCEALSIPTHDAWRFRVAPASLTTLEFRPQQRRTLLAGLNDVCHLESSKQQATSTKPA